LEDGPDEGKAAVLPHTRTTLVSLWLIKDER
jgi:hypothetical protein